MASVWYDYDTLATDLGALLQAWQNSFHVATGASAPDVLGGAALWREDLNHVTAADRDGR